MLKHMLDRWKPKVHVFKTLFIGTRYMLGTPQNAPTNKMIGMLVEEF